MLSFQPSKIKANTAVSLKPGEFTGIKVLAAVTVVVAAVLAALAVYLCLNRNRQNWNGKGDYKMLHINTRKKFARQNRCNLIPRN